MDVSFQVKEVADTIAAMTQGQMQELSAYLKSHYCLYLGTVPQEVDIVHHAVGGGSCDSGLPVNALAYGGPFLSPSNVAAEKTLTDMREAQTGTSQRVNSIVLTSFIPAKKISVIKVMRELTGMGLAEAKHAVESTPYLVAKHVPLHMAQNARNRLVDAGGVVVIH